MKLHIPQPCHENWNAMTQQEKGRYCNACEKVVVDFTQMSDADIVEYFQRYKKEDTCGNVRSDQLLQKEEIKINIDKLPGNISFRSILAICFITFFSSMFLISCHSSKEVMGKMKITKSERKKIKKADKDFRKMAKHNVRGKLAK